MATLDTQPVHGWELLPCLKMAAEKRVKDTGELTKVADTDMPQKKLTPTAFLCRWDLGKAF